MSNSETLKYIRQNNMVVRDGRQVCVQAAVDTSIRDYLVQDPQDLDISDENCYKKEGISKMIRKDMLGAALAILMQTMFLYGAKAAGYGA